MAPVSVTQQARVLVGLAVVGAIPLTIGAIMWLVGTVMGSVYHGGWSGTAGLGEVLLLAGLLCGLVLFLLAAAGEHWTLPGSWGQSRKTPRALTPLASPEQQAFLAGPPPSFAAGPPSRSEATLSAQPSFPAGPPFPAEPPFQASPQPSTYRAGSPAGPASQPFPAVGPASQPFPAVGPVSQPFPDVVQRPPEAGYPPPVEPFLAEPRFPPDEQWPEPEPPPPPPWAAR